MSKAGNKKRRNSYILTASALLAVVYFIFSLFCNQSKLDTKQAQINAVIEQRKALQFENAEIERMLKPENEQEYLERMARIQEGYVYPDERVYRDIS